MDESDLLIGQLTHDLVKLIPYGAMPKRVVTKPALRFLFDVPDDKADYMTGEAMRQALKRHVQQYDGTCEIFGRTRPITDVRIAFMLLLGLDLQVEDVTTRRMIAIIRLQSGHAVDMWRRYGPERNFISLLAQNMIERCMERSQSDGLAPNQ